MGQKYAAVDGEGRSRAFYDDDVNSVIPPEAFTISEPTWREWIANPRTRHWNGTQLVAWKDTNEFTVDVLMGAIQVEMENRTGPDDRTNLSHVRAHAKDLEDDSEPVDFKVTLHNGVVVRIQTAAQARGLAKQALNVAAHYMNLASGLVESVQGMTDGERASFDVTLDSHWPDPA